MIVRFTVNGVSSDLTLDLGIDPVCDIMHHASVLAGWQAGSRVGATLDAAGIFRVTSNGQTVTAEIVA